MSACTDGEGDTVTRLLQEGVSVLSMNEDGDTGLHLCCEKGHEEVAKIFLRKKRRPLANKAEVELMYLVIRDKILGQLMLVPKQYTYTN